MKKILLFSTSLVMTSMLYSQEFSASADFGFPTGKIAQHTSANVGVGIAYTQSISEKFSLGLTTGYSHYFMKANSKDLGTIPLALKAQGFFSSVPLYVDLDFGYSFTTNEAFKGGLYLYPKMGYRLGENAKLYVGYKNTMSSYKFNMIGNTLINPGSLNLASVNFGIDWRF